MNNNKLVLIITLIISLGLLVTGCNGNPTGSDGDIVAEGEIKGQIVEPLGENSPRPASALVTLHGDNDYRTYAEADWEGNTKIVGGTFSKNEIKAGAYTLKVHKMGYETITENITVDENEITDLDSIEIALKDNFDRDGLMYCGVNTSVKPLDDLELRKALAYGIDWDDYESWMGEGKGIANRIMTPYTTGYKNEKVTYDYDLSKAESILDQAGYTTGELDLTINVTNTAPAHSNIANKLKSYWEKIDHINTVTIESYSWENFNDKIFNNEVGLYISGWTIDNPDPVFLLDTFIKGHLDNSKQVDDLIQKAKMNVDDKTKALNYLYEIEEKVISNALIYPINYYDYQEN